MFFPITCIVAGNARIFNEKNAATALTGLLRSAEIRLLRAIILSRHNILLKAETGQCFFLCCAYTRAYARHVAGDPGREYNKGRIIGRIIEAVERTDKTFAAGLQFHPEAALVKHLENAENQNDFMDYDTALSFFRWIVQERYLEQDAADAA